ncbi:MAG: hypothetical protein J6Y02_23620 [Pseudobutyrivibrio sp.]|nr:hypothetical protein [Pseudobutyrivibrio sp.]
MKFEGKIGFWIEDNEEKPGLFKPGIVEKSYTGDVSRDNRHWNAQSNTTNSEYKVNNEISVLADLYARQNWNSIRYVLWNDIYWSVTSVTLGYPRITLVLGGVYNGERAN